MYSTRIPRIVLVAVLCLLIVGSGIVVADYNTTTPLSDDFEDGVATGWSVGDLSSEGYGDQSQSLSIIGTGEDTNSDATVDKSDFMFTARVKPDRQALYRIDAGNIFLTLDTTEESTGGWYSLLTVGGAEDDLGVEIDANEWYELKIAGEGDNYRAKIWEAGAEEPDVWGANLTQSGVTGSTSLLEITGTGSVTNHQIDEYEIGNTSHFTSNTVSGEVTDNNNEQLADVNVTAERDGDIVEYDETNDVGQYDIELVENGTYTLTASKQGYRSETATVTISGSDAQQDFQLVQFNQSINLDTKRFIEHGQWADYRVIVQNDTGRHNITGDATVTSGDGSVVTVDTAALQLQATTDISVNQRTPVTAEWTDSEGNIYTTQTNVTVANATVENIDILPTWTKTSASLGDETMQLIIVATMIGAAAALLASSFAGLSAATGVTVLGWFAGMASDGVLIVSFMMAIFIGLNLAGNVNMQVRQ